MNDNRVGYTLEKEVIDGVTYSVSEWDDYFTITKTKTEGHPKRVFLSDSKDEALDSFQRRVKEAKRKVEVGDRYYMDGQSLFHRDEADGTFDCLALDVISIDHHKDEVFLRPTDCDGEVVVPSIIKTREHLSEISRKKTDKSISELLSIVDTLNN